MVADEVEVIQSTPHASPTINPLTGLLSSASDVAIDIMEMGELQVRLAKLDTQSAIDRSIVGAILVFGGGAMAIASMPLIALGLANAISDNFDIPLWKVQIVIGAASTCSALLLVALGAIRLRYAMTSFSRTSSELLNNVNWLKQLVRGLKTTDDSRD
jgi:hypothetical protein